LAGCHLDQVVGPPNLSRRAGFYMQKPSFKKIGIIAISLSCLFLASLMLNAESAPAAEKFKPFKLNTLDGAKKTLQDFKNKATLVAFYYPTCAYCNLAIPEILKIYEKYKGLGLSMVIINVAPEENKLIPGWQEKYHCTIPVLIGASKESLMDDYSLTMTPTHILLGNKGEVLFRQNGYNRGDEKNIEKKISEALNFGLN
jgi:thioredoxin-related protein